MTNVQIISAPSILGLRPRGVEKLAASLLANGLHERLKTTLAKIEVPTLNDQYDPKRDATGCLNTDGISRFSKRLAREIQATISDESFALTLGGDCSILVGIMLGLNPLGKFGLLFIDAHADFYSPETSITGEVADMDLAIVCGHGPDVLTNIDGLKPYVAERHVIHVGQRDQEETARYDSPDIAQTEITRMDLNSIRQGSIEKTTADVIDHLRKMELDRLWIHFDTDSLSDKINPAVDYRLPGGLEFKEVELLVKAARENKKVAGMSVTCFNPAYDRDGVISRNITESLGRMLD